MQTEVVQRRVSTQEEPSMTSFDLTDEARLRTARRAFPPIPRTVLLVPAH